MVFHFLEHWWDIYAPFEPVPMSILDKTYVHPHYGQVIHYMRRLRHKSKQDVVRDLHWSANYIRKIEASPNGTNHFGRNFGLIPYLQIPPPLLGMDEDLFLPDTPDKARHSVMEMVKGDLLESGTFYDIEHLLDVYRRTREPNFLPLTVQEMQMYNEALYKCQKPLSSLSELEDMLEEMRSSANKMTNGRTHNGFAMGRSGRSREQKSLIKARQGILMIEHWQEHLSQAMTHSIGTRYDQLVYIRHYLYKLVAYDFLLTQEAIAEIGPERKLAYATGRVETAVHLMNPRLLAESLLDRIKLYLKREQFDLAVEDARRLMFCIDVMGNILNQVEEVTFYLNDLHSCIDLAKGGAKISLRALSTKAQQMAQSMTKVPTPVS